MKKASGFTLIELILTLVLTAILAGIVVEIIAGPIRSYFWVTQQALKVENAELALSNIVTDLQVALPSSVEINNNNDTHNMVFRKILYEGLIVPTDRSNPKLFSVLGKFGQAVDLSKSYFLYLPLEKDPTFYSVQIKETNTGAEVMLAEALKDWKNKPTPFYLLSNPIHIECNKSTHRLERIEDENAALINDSIAGCQFVLFGENQYKGVVVSLLLGSKGEKSSRFTQPILFEKIL